jgi:hypothetical protein
MKEKRFKRMLHVLILVPLDAKLPVEVNYPTSMTNNERLTLSAEKPFSDLICL